MVNCKYRKYLGGWGYKMKNKQLELFITSYIEKCDDILQLKDLCECKVYNMSNYEVQEKARYLQEEIVSAFEEFIPYITRNLDSIGVAFPGAINKEVDYIGNIKKLKSKLELLIFTNGTYKIESEDDKSNGIENPSVIVNANNSVSGSGNSTNSNTNTNTNTVDIKAELSRVRDEIKADEMIDDTIKEEIFEKLSQIESVINENPSNTEKWKKLKGIMVWLGSKTYGIAKTIAPVIINAIFNSSN